MKQILPVVALLFLAFGAIEIMSSLVEESQPDSVGLYFERGRFGGEEKEGIACEIEEFCGEPGPPPRPEDPPMMFDDISTI